MGTPGQRNHGWKTAASGLVVFLGLYHGAVPLVVRLAFDRDQRLAPALWLPSPWWWIACLGVVAVSLGLLTALHADDEPAPSDPSGAPSGAAASKSESGGGYDVASAVVLLAGIYNGVVPFVARLVFDGNQALALPLRLPAPWWWIASLAVVAVTVVLLTLIDQAKERRNAGDPVSDRP
jgi:hypothetical protein